MTSRTALLTATLLAASAPTAALARPTIIVGDAIPFSADDLATAVSIRSDSTAAIRVDREGDLLVITVGDQVRSIDVVGLDDPHDLARIVALVIVALDAPLGDAPLAPIAPPRPPAVAPPPTPLSAPPPVALPLPGSPITEAPGTTGSLVLFGGGANALPPPKNWTLRASIGLEQSDLRAQLLQLSLSRRLGPWAHVVLGIGYDKHEIWTMDLGTEEVEAVPVKAGLELRYGWAAIEGGLAAKMYYDTTCMTDAVATGGYGTARVYLFPLGAIQNRTFVEAGIRHVVQSACTVDSISSTPLTNRDTAAHLSLGLELPL